MSSLNRLLRPMRSALNLQRTSKFAMRRQASPDGIHRIPILPAASRPITLEDDLSWPDAQAPEPVLDADHVLPVREIVAMLGAAFAGIYGFYKYTESHAPEPPARTPHAPHIAKALFPAGVPEGTK